MTLPLLTALKRCPVGEREAISAELKDFARAADRGEPADEQSRAFVADAVERYHGVEVTLERARECTHDARAQIEPFIDGDAKRSLIALCDFVVARRS